MLWIWFFLVTTKELFLKIAAPKRQVKSMKTTCEVISFYYICNLYTWNLWKEILHKHFSRVLLRLLVMSFLKKRKNNKTDIDFLNFILIITWTKLNTLITNMHLPVDYWFYCTTLSNEMSSFAKNKKRFLIFSTCSVFGIQHGHVAHGVPWMKSQQQNKWLTPNNWGCPIINLKLVSGQ